MSTRRALGLIAGLSTVAMVAFLVLFILRNAPGFSAPVTISTLAGLYGLLNAWACLVLLKALDRRDKSTVTSPGLWRVAALLAAALLVYIFLDSAVTDYYQPLSLYNDAIAALATWWLLLVLLSALSVLPTASRAATRATAVMVLLAAAGWPLAASLSFINSPQVSNLSDINRHVFIGGKDDYAVYRIPGLTLIPAGSKLAAGNTLSNDRLLAFAEARRDGALDTGVIDLVLKISDDAGASWSEQAVICRHQQGKRRGKCGNPTPLFDAETGKLLLAYNLSGVNPGPLEHSGHLMVSEDAGESWGRARQIAGDNFVFGPGKGTRKLLAPGAGRLLLPGHVNNTAQLLYSDDNGNSWHRSAGVAGGNESDVSELSGGQLYLASRHAAPIAMAPEPNGRQFSISSDAGSSWLPGQVDTRLATPVCQVAIIRYGDSGGLLFSNPAHDTSRVRMTLRYSLDDGASWPHQILVYPGPAGYSVLATGSDNAVYLLYENGNMAYSQRISIARISADNLLPSMPVPSNNPDM